MKKGDPKPVAPIPISKNGKFDRKRYTLEFFDYLTANDEADAVEEIERKKAEMHQKAKRRL